jgi:hypothetical protein
MNKIVALIIGKLTTSRPLPIKVIFVAAAFHLAPFSFVVLFPFAIAPTLLRFKNIVLRSTTA